MGLSSTERRQRAVALVVNDNDETRRHVTNRLYKAAIGTVVSPGTFEAFLTDLTGPTSLGAPKFALVILDYELDDWTGTFQGVKRKVTFADVFPIVQNSVRRQGARIFILTAFPRRARQDPMLQPYHYDVIDDTNSSTSTFEDIVKMSLG